MTYFGKKGKQEQARYERLVKEIITYVTNNPKVTSADIVGHLSVNIKMRNHGLTPRKIGLFIPRNCKEDLKWANDSGRRFYFPRKQRKTFKEETLEDLVKDD
jgi:hypothetical protein